MDGHVQKMIRRTAAAGIGICLLLFGVAQRAQAIGTHAATSFSNRATVTCTIAGTTYTAQSNIYTIRVAEVLNVAVTWQDASPVTAVPGQTNRATTFRVTNTGNGNETFSLSATGSGVGGDNFDPTVTAIYLDANGNGSYDPGVDTLYAAGVNDPALAPDGSLTVFVLSTIPAAGVVDGDTGNVTLTASSKTGVGAPGTVFALQGDGGVDAIIGASGGQQTATGAYIVSNVVVQMTKSFVVTDQYGGNKVITGATIRYTVIVTVVGGGTATGIVVTDPIPANTVYTAGSLKLNGSALTDAADGDAGDENVTTANAVTVKLSDLTSASAPQTIVFDVMIK